MHDTDGQISVFSYKISCEPITPLKTQVLIKKKKKENSIEVKRFLVELNRDFNNSIVLFDQ